jgi:hypothetical protein
VQTSLALAMTIALSLACGPGDRAPAPGPAGPPATPQPDATPDSTTATPPPPPTPPAGPVEQRFVTIERLDADAECDGLAPAAVPEPVAARVENPGGVCEGGLSDGTGHVAVRISPSLPWGERQTFSPQGAPEKRFLVWDMNDGVAPEAIAMQPDGWLIVVGQYSHGPSTVSLLSLLADGGLRRTESFSPVGGRSWQFGADPRGGGFLVTNRFASSPTDPCVAEGRRFDALGAPTGGTASVGCSVIAAGVSTLGEALAIERGGAAADRSVVHWVRADGSHALPPADEGDLVALFDHRLLELVPLLDGSIAARSDAGWIRRYPRLAPGGEAPPAWLAARGAEVLRFTRGNRGYALMSVAGQASAECRQAIELLAPSGRRCVRLTFREDATGCTTGAIDQGWDGTVVQQSGKDPCAYRWWPRLLGE